MHNQALVIYPRDIELKDVMYPYQEIDKTVPDKILDNRCVFSLVIPEEDIESALNCIKEHYQNRRNESLEILQYRSEHTYAETKQKYGNSIEYCFELYKHSYDVLKKYEEVKNLPSDDPRQISFIKDYYDWANPNAWLNIYINGKGYGNIDNPYDLWDFYTIVNEHRFAEDVNFLVSRDGQYRNIMPFERLDVDRTVENIESLTHVWRYIIFCEKYSKDSVVYVKDRVFEDISDKFHQVYNLRDKLDELQRNYLSGFYMVTAIDFHF